MILYNITTLVSWKIHDAWMNWLTGIHIPGMLATGAFTRYQLVRLLEVSEEEGPTYALQLYAVDTSAFLIFRKEYEKFFEHRSTENWGDMASSFTSVMEVIN